MRKQLKTCSRICPAAHGWDWGLLLELGEALDNLLKDHVRSLVKKKKLPMASWSWSHRKQWQILGGAAFSFPEKSMNIWGLRTSVI